MLVVNNNKKEGVFFLHGYGGTSKTFMWQKLASYLRSKHDIVLTIASSFILLDGRTTHHKFKIHVPTLDNSTCKIDHDNDLTELLRETKLIIWNEAPMTHKYYFEARDKTLKDVMNEKRNPDTILEGKVIVFCGYFDKYYMLYIEVVILILCTLQLMLHIFGIIIKFQT